MKYVKLIVISTNYYLRYGWVAYINEIQPELISSTGKICDIDTYGTLLELKLKSTNSRNDCCVLIDSDILAEVTTSELKKSITGNNLRVFVINNTRQPANITNRNMPYKPSLRIIKQYIVEAMDNREFHLTDEVKTSLTSLSKKDIMFLKMICTGMTISDISSKINIPSKRLYYKRRRILEKIGANNINEVIISGGITEYIMSNF